MNKHHFKALVLVFVIVSGCGGGGGSSSGGNITEKTLVVAMFLGVNAIPIETWIDFTASNGGFAFATLNNHYGMDVNDRRLLGVRAMC